MSQNKAPFIFIIVALVMQLVFLNGCSNQQAIQKAAEDGDANAQYQTGFNYENGIGVPQDSKKAIYWYQLSAKQGNSWAQNNLHHLTGQGIKANTQELTSNKTSSTAPSTALNQEAPKSNESKNVSYPSGKPYVWIKTETTRVETVRHKRELCEDRNNQFGIVVHTTDKTLFYKNSPKLLQLLSEFSKLILQECPNTNFDKDGNVIAGYLNGQYKYFGYSNITQGGSIFAEINDVDKFNSEERRLRAEENKRAEESEKARKAIVDKYEKERAEESRRPYVSDRELCDCMGGSPGFMTTCQIGPYAALSSFYYSSERDACRKKLQKIKLQER